MSAPVIENRGASPHDGLHGMVFQMKHHCRIDYARREILWAAPR